MQRASFGFVIIVLLAAGCADDRPGHSAARISCTTTPDCSARGGTCVAGECHADNECATAADCAAGDTCAPDPDFGGLCAAPDTPPSPGPAWACTTGKDCPAFQGCGSDGLCHLDGECTSDAACAAGDICYPGRPEDPAGFCAADRPASDPYCRSDGLGACRQLCHTDGTCDGGASCVAGFCHSADECTSDADCSPNHLCAPTEGEDYGYELCVPNPSPTCVDDGHGACRLACATDADCLDGGGCSADHLCHASNECAADADCTASEICYPDAEFGGLCGAPRP